MTGNSGYNNLYVPKIKTPLELGLFLFILKMFWSSSKVFYYNDFIDTILTALAVGSLFVSIISQRYSLRILVIYAVISLFSIYNYMETGLAVIMVTVITCLAIRGKDFQKVIEFIYRYELLLLALHLIATIVCVCIGYNDFISISGARIRFDFGYSHANVASVYAINIALMYIWRRYESIGIKQILAIAVILGLVAGLTKTRTVWLSIILITVLLIISKKAVIFKNVLSFLARWMLPLFSIFMFLLWNAFLNSNTISIILDQLLSGRIRMGAYTYITYGLSFLGKEIGSRSITWDPFWRLTGFTFDDIYSYFFMCQGLLWLLVIIILFFLLAKKQNVKINFMLIMWAFLGITEIHGLDCYSGFPLLLVVQLFDMPQSMIVREESV